jgi:hypothetical protein
MKPCRKERGARLETSASYASSVRGPISINVGASPINR